MATQKTEIRLIAVVTAKDDTRSCSMLFNATRTKASISPITSTSRPGSFRHAVRKLRNKHKIIRKISLDIAKNIKIYEMITRNAYAHMYNVSISSPVCFLAEVKV